MNDVSVPQVLFYGILGAFALALIVVLGVWLFHFFGEIRYLSTNDIRKRRRRKLPRAVVPVLAFFVIFGTAYGVAWLYTLDPDFTIWTSEVRGYVCVFGGGPALIIACILYLQAIQPKH